MLFAVLVYCVETHRVRLVVI